MLLDHIAVCNGHSDYVFYQNFNRVRVTFGLLLEELLVLKHLDSADTLLENDFASHALRLTIRKLFEHVMHIIDQIGADDLIASTETALLFLETQTTDRIVLLNILTHVLVFLAVLGLS